jgi:flavin-dependent dehydrogenase
MNSLVLQDGSRVAIIGGGPAGSFFAFFLQKYAQQKGIQLAMTIFDAKDFLLKGPKGCNLCAGVISETLNQRLGNEGIHLPEQRIIHRVDGYCVHLDHRRLFLTGEGDKTGSIATVFRGNGPRYSTFSGTISFDDFLLTLAQDYGASVVLQPVHDIELSGNPSRPASLFYGSDGDIQEQEFDLVVGAFGVNSQLTAKVQELGFGYVPPVTLRTYQSEVLLDREKIAQEFGNLIHVYMPRSKLILVVTVIPKGDFLSLTFIGRKDITQEALPEFSEFSRKNLALDLTPQCTCFPRIVLSAAHKPYTHRMVMIGDASCTRYYKNGIESAFLTAELAAQAAVYHGIDAGSFAAHYYRPANKIIIQDNRYGRFLFRFNDMLSAVPALQRAHIDLAAKDSTSKSARMLRSILWNMFTGNQSYKAIFKKALNLRLQIALLVQAVRACFPK